MKLTFKQKQFCQHYIEACGNGTEAVVKAGYKVGKKGTVDRNLAKSIASENLTKPDVRKHIEQLLEAKGFNDESVQLQHLELISQTDNLSIKARAIDMYYKLKGKYTQNNNLDIEVKGVFDEAVAHIRTILPAAGQ